MFEVPVEIDRELTPSLPAVPDRPAPAAATVSAPKTAVAGAPVLLVDDNPINRRVAEIMLGQFGLEVVQATNGQECLDRLDAGLRPVFILMDVQMPVLDGLSATRLIREREAREYCRRTPVIALTGGVFEDDATRCRDAGMDDFLAKPLDAAQFRRVVTRWLDGAGAPTADS